VLLCQPLDATEAEERVASLEADLEALQEQNGEESLKQGHPLSHGSSVVALAAASMKVHQMP
jgi:hypothetical protein